MVFLCCVRLLSTDMLHANKCVRYLHCDGEQAEFCIGMFIYRYQVVLLFAVEPVRGVCMPDHLSH
jgi:hypothetical protein